MMTSNELAICFRHVRWSDASMPGDFTVSMEQHTCVCSEVSRTNKKRGGEKHIPMLEPSETDFWKKGGGRRGDFKD